ncbi:acyl-CoA-binding protein [Flammeovirga aprica]|uniref:Acyl-CoA-binding protein n=1 Tax=Flammeovirga aprica JL-4 TaxID=694437 RepID=A0A7X9RZ92_9BACT|nr:acyl-CoA-binding protein [Flammeovirga aprica]NME71438.1 acyl-CoA-binding protein [Flammeovirga aprica JL-4]
MASDAFKDAQVRVNQLSERPSNDDLLKLYAFYKQATEGDVNTERPGGFDFKGNAKWDAWKKIEGTSADSAESQYITLVNQLEG